MPVVPVEQDGGALADAIFGWDQEGEELGQVEWVRPEDEYYCYNPPRGRG